MRYAIEETEAFRILARRAAEAEARPVRHEPRTPTRRPSVFSQSEPKDRAVLCGAVISAWVILLSLGQLSRLL